MYEPQSLKLARAFDLLRDFIPAALVIIKLEPPTISVVELYKK